MADDTRTPGASAMWVEPTGSAVAMYSCTTALRIAVLRSSSIWQSRLPSANGEDEGSDHGAVISAMTLP